MLAQLAARAPAGARLIFVEDKYSTLEKVCATPGFEAWELYLGARRLPIFATQPTQRVWCARLLSVSGSERKWTDADAAAPTYYPRVHPPYPAVDWGYNTPGERAAAAANPRIRVVGVREFADILSGKWPPPAKK